MRIMFLSHLPENPKAKERNDKVRSQLNAYASPGTQVDLCFPDDYPGAKLSLDLVARNEVPGIYHVLQTPAIIRKIIWAEKNGYDAVVQSNTFDPGVEAARHTVRIPVIGVLRATLHTAMTLSNSVAIIVPLEEHIAYTWQIVQSYGMQSFVKDIAAVGLYDESAEKRVGEIFARAAEAIRATTKRTGAGCVIPLGGAVFPTLVSPKDLEREVGVPVLNTKAVGIRFAETCVQLGMTQSPSSYPWAQLRYEDLTASAK
ncbi:MAG: aspartate/glutamate racemase family protein [Candidatus Binatia bacterium]